MIVTISGMPGSGKSTIKALIAERFGLTPYSAGDMRGKVALERGLTIDELNALGETEAFTDRDVDEYQTRLGKTEDNFVIDGRLSWHFIPQSIKIFLTIDPSVGARRIFEAKRSAPGSRSDEPLYANVEAAERAIAERIASDHARYEKWYGINFEDPAHYDLVIDTTSKTPEEVLESIVNFIQAGQA